MIAKNRVLPLVDLGEGEVMEEGEEEKDTRQGYIVTAAHNQFPLDNILS